MATRADCTRRQVGAVILDIDNRLIATGYNGAPSGRPGCLTDNACPRGQLSYEEVQEFSDYRRGPGTCIAAHAELNALLYARTSCKGSTVYVTARPCPECLAALDAAKVHRIVWLEDEETFELVLRPRI